MDEQKQHPVDDEENKPQRRGRPITREAIERLRQIREEIMKERNGELFEDSTEMIRQMREERTKQLMQAVTGQYDEEEESTTSEQIVFDQANESRRRRRPLTPETFDRLHQISEEIMKDRNGELFEDSTEMIRQMREDRTKQLMQAAAGQYDDEEENTTTEQIVPDEANMAQQRSIPEDFLEQVHRIREQVIQDSKGELFEDSAELIRREREKRTEYLMQVISGEYGKDPYEEDTAEEQP